MNSLAHLLLFYICIKFRKRSRLNNIYKYGLYRLLQNFGSRQKRFAGRRQKGVQKACAEIPSRLEPECGGAYWSSSGDGSEFSDFFEQMFGGMGGRGRHSHGFRGQDYTTELQVSLTDAAKTHKQIITVNGKNLRITIPAGIADGQTIKLRGQGGPGVNGGPAGDLYITFHIPEDSRFKRVGDDLYVTVPLNLYTAILGGEQIVETMDSKAKLKVKPGTQNNTKVRLRGKGFPVYKEEGKFGDMIVTYSIDIPTNLTDKQKELFREIQSLN